MRERGSNCKYKAEVQIVLKRLEVSVLRFTLEWAAAWPRAKRAHGRLARCQGSRTGTATVSSTEGVDADGSRIYMRYIYYKFMDKQAALEQ